MRSAEDGVQPGIPPLESVPRTLCPCTVDQQLPVCAIKNLRCESSRDVSFDAEPFVRVIRQGCSNPDGAGVEDGRAKPDPGESETQLPADDVVPGIQKPWLGGRSSRVRCVER